MRLKLRHSGNVILLVGLLLTPLAMAFASPTSPAPASIQPDPLVPPPLFEIPLTNRTSAGFDPALLEFMVPAPASTPENLALAPDVAGTAVNGIVNNQISVPAEAAQPGKDRTPTRLVFPSVHNRIIEPAEPAQPGEDRTPTRLVIPAIRLDAPVESMGWHTEIRDRQPVNIWDVPDHFAAGWLKTSAPVGLPGNTVLDGHHNIRGRVFKDLVRLEVGDIITLYTASHERVYRVDQILILEEAGQTVEVRRANAQYIYPTADERLTLVTCWPPTGNSSRLIIIARPVVIGTSLPGSEYSAISQPARGMPPCTLCILPLEKDGWRAIPHRL